MDRQKTVLIVEDEKNIVDILRFNLQREGYQTREAYDGEDGLNKARGERPDLILLDVMLPRMNGFEVCRALRQAGDNVPVIILTAREEETDKVLGLELGADDYITKPYSVPVLLARIKAVLRRSGNGPEQADLLEAGELRLSLTKGSVSSGGKAAELSRNELQILACLMAHAGQIVSRADLIDALWDNQIYIDDNTLGVNMTRLRGKLAEIGLPDAIKTRRGMGYQL